MDVGILFASTALSYGAVSVFAGRAADRFDRRLLCIVADCGRAVVAFAIPLATVLRLESVWIVWVASAGIAVGDAVFSPASQALIKDIIPAHRYEAFCSVFEVVGQGATLLSVALGGWIIDQFGTVPVLLYNALSYLVSAFLLSRLVVRSRPAAAPPTCERSSPLARGAPAMSRRVVPCGVLFSLVFVVGTLCNMLLVPLIIGARGASVFLLGVTDSVATMGSILGALLFMRALVLAPAYLIALGGLALCGLILIVEPYGGVAWTMACEGASALFFGMAQVAVRSQLLGAIARESAGRVIGIFSGSGRLAAAGLALAVSRSVDMWSVQVAYGVLGGLVLATVTAVAAGTWLSTWQVALPPAGDGEIRVDLRDTDAWSAPMLTSPPAEGEGRLAAPNGRDELR